MFGEGKILFERFLTLAFASVFISLLLLFASNDNLSAFGISVPLNSTTDITSSPNPSLFGQLVSLPVTVQFPPDSPNIPSGAINFFDGETSLGNITGFELPNPWNVSLVIGYLSVGTHNIRAVYSGDSNYNSSASNVISQIVYAPQSILAIQSVDSDHNPIPGFWATLSQNGTLVASGFTPINFTVNSGQQYQISIGNFDENSFEFWDESGSSDNPRTISIFSDTQITAVYGPTHFPIIRMADTSESAGYGVHAPKPVRAEYVSSTSNLAGDKIDSITLTLKKVGTISGNAQIGVFNSDLTIKKSFGTLNVATLANSYTNYTFNLGGSELYTIQPGDRIGIKYTGGDVNNWVSVMLDLDPADPFDGINSYHQYYQSGSWHSNTERDMTMILMQTHGGESFPIISMLDTTASYGVRMDADNQNIVAEWVKPSSQLVGAKIDSITLRLQRVGFPTGAAQIAVFDVNKNVKREFGSILAGAGTQGINYHSDIPSTMTDMEFTLPSSDPLYTIAADDRIGIFWTGGSGNDGSVSVMMDKVTSDPLFDGKNTQRVRGTSTGWITGDVNEDLYMILKQTHVGP